MNLKQRLDYHYKAFDKSQISPDPLQFLHLFSDPKDIEVMGFIASVFAYGNIKQIINTLSKIVAASENNPYLFVKNFNSKVDSEKLKGIKHRFYSEKDIIDLFSILNLTYKKFGLLRNLFLKFYNVNEINLKNSISNFSNHFLGLEQKSNKIKNLSLGFKFMFPLPELGSACKRMNLFLRWMVRKDDLDFGLWSEIPTNKLIIPVDIHVARICKQLKLTKRKNVSWKMAEEITANLKKFDRVDPVKYDFAICHIGMRKLPF
jgi:uncharacterized protein (TIGR02757 family)